MNRTAILGLDLGQSDDRSAATILYRKPEPQDHIAERYGKEHYGPFDERWRCISIRRWPQHTDYTKVIDDVLRSPEDAGVGVIVVEYNGVGRPWVDFMCREATKRNIGQLKIVPVITSPSSHQLQMRDDPHGRFKVHAVPKIDLVSAADLLQQRDMLVFSGQIPELPLLFNEMGLFRMKYSKAANLQFGNEPGRGNHDDMVISFCLACWWANRLRTFAIFAG